MTEKGNKVHWLHGDQNRSICSSLDRFYIGSADLSKVTCGNCRRVIKRRRRKGMLDEAETVPKCLVPEQ